MNLGIVLFNVLVNKVVEQTRPFNPFWACIKVTDLI